MASGGKVWPTGWSSAQTPTTVEADALPRRRLHHGRDHPAARGARRRPSSAPTRGSTTPAGTPGRAGAQKPWRRRCCAWTPSPPIRSRRCRRSTMTGGDSDSIAAVTGAVSARCTTALARQLGYTPGAPLSALDRRSRALSAHGLNHVLPQRRWRPARWVARDWISTNRSAGNRNEVTGHLRWCGNDGRSRPPGSRHGRVRISTAATSWNCAPTRQWLRRAGHHDGPLDQRATCRNAQARGARRQPGRLAIPSGRRG